MSIKFNTSAFKIRNDDGSYSDVIPSLSGNNIVVDPSLTIAGNAADAKKVGDEIKSLKDELATFGGGLSSAIKSAWKGHIQEVAYTSTSHPFTDALLALIDGSGSDEPVNPNPPSGGDDTPTTPTLQSITVTWSGDSADVGTDPRTLITSVKANMSDGTNQTVTGYTVTPSSLVEGSNTVTVSYGGKTSTKTITGNPVGPSVIYLDTLPVVAQSAQVNTGNANGYTTNAAYSAYKVVEATDIKSGDVIEVGVPNIQPNNTYAEITSDGVVAVTEMVQKIAKDNYVWYALTLTATRDIPKLYITFHDEYNDTKLRGTITKK